VGLVGATLPAMNAETVVANDHGLTVASVVNNRDGKPDEVANR